MVAEEIVALDVGTVRTGIARASKLARLAQPLKTVPTDEVIEELRRLSLKSQITKVVVGLPRNLRGDDTQQTEWVRHFVEDAKTQLPKIDFYLQDEALTSVSAQESGKKVTDIDAEAARIILQDFLDSESSS